MSRSTPCKESPKKPENAPALRLCCDPCCADETHAVLCAVLCAVMCCRYEVNRLELMLSMGSFAAALGAMIAGG